MVKLDLHGLREYVARDWSLPERLARSARASQPIGQKVALAIALYEASRAARPTWPDDATRRADLAMHERLRALLDRAAHVGRR